MNDHGLYLSKMMPEADPGRTSRTILVPAAVPSVRHNSRPYAVVVAAKYRYWLDGYSISIVVGAEPGEMSATGWVPAAVPSLVHSSRPRPLASHMKYARPRQSTIGLSKMLPPSM